MAKNVSDSGRVFKNPILEALTRTHIAIPLTLFYGSGLAVLIYAVVHLRMPVMGSIILFLAGAFFFTLVEYLVHRYFYHMEASSASRKRIQYLFHGVHHDHPRDKKRLALPPIMTVLVAIMFIGLFRLLMGLEGYAFGGGFMVGYASYLYIHYAIHIIKPPKNFLNVIWKHHNLHHFVDSEGAFGVSSPFWDHVFRTMPRDRRGIAEKLKSA
ncbi:MAG: sterol desaturase family protein [Flavobacteriales bacterium]|nr:sterol desaturase family protein [Flavobacteriales bacterium]